MRRDSGGRTVPRDGDRLGCGSASDVAGGEEARALVRIAVGRDPPLLVQPQLSARNDVRGMEPMHGNTALSSTRSRRAGRDVARRHGFDRGSAADLVDHGAEPDLDPRGPRTRRWYASWPVNDEPRWKMITSPTCSASSSASCRAESPPPMTPTVRSR